MFPKNKGSRVRVCELNDLALKQQMKQPRDSNQVWEKKGWQKSSLMHRTKSFTAGFSQVPRHTSTLQKEAFKRQRFLVLLYRQCREALSLEWTPQSHIPLEEDNISVGR